jgi:hypothetical protein
MTAATRNNSPFELDHVSIIVRMDAPEAALLENLGLQRFGGVTHHEGMGTASTSFFFENAYLELLWAYDGALAQEKFSVVQYDLDLRARWQDTFASPFGVMLRRKLGRTDAPPFPTLPFQFSSEQRVEFAAQNSAEPAIGFLPAGLTYPSFKQNITQRHHSMGLKEITRVTINIYDDAEPSLLARWLTENGILTIQSAAYANLELEFDGNAQGQALNARPDLPLVLKY